MNNVTPPHEVVTFLAGLSPRELRVLWESRPHRPVKEIADALHRSVNTVKIHRKSALKKWLMLTRQITGGQPAFR